MEKPSDDALMRAIQADEPDAFEEFVRRYQKRFYRIAMGYMRDHDEALDAVQGAFIRIHRARARWTPQAQPFTWSYRILVNHCIDLIRKRRIREATPLESPKIGERDLEDRVSASPFDHSAGQEIGAAIRAAVADLPDRQREIFTLRHFEELSLQEIAEVQGCALGTVKSSLHRAVMTLREKLTDFSQDTHVDCKNIQAELITARYGGLEPPARRRLDEHLEGCPACRVLARSLDDMLAAITPAVVFPQEASVNWELPLTCAAVRAELTALGDGEMPEERWEDAMAHLGRCASCATEAASIHETLALTRQAFPGEDRVDWDAFARETVRKAREAEGPARMPRRSRWGMTAQLLPVAASLAAAAVLVYLSVGTPPSDLDLPAAPPVTTNSLDSRPPADTGEQVITPQVLQRAQVELAKSNAAQYLSQSRNLLLSLTDLAAPCGTEKVDITVERQQSNRLLRRKQFLEHDLQDVEVARAQRLAYEIESLLAEVASLEDCVPSHRVREIRDLVQQRQLMMRIEMITNELGSQRA